jgi:hypothetical protein
MPTSYSWMTLLDMTYQIHFLLIRIFQYWIESYRN